MPVCYEEANFKKVYLDEYTREPLPHKPVVEANTEEREYFNSRVWELADAQQVGDKQTKVVRTRRVLTNKGDAEKPDVRARLAACEINAYRVG